MILLGCVGVTTVLAGQIRKEAAQFGTAGHASFIIDLVQLRNNHV